MDGSIFDTLSSYPQQYLFLLLLSLQLFFGKCFDYVGVQMSQKLMYVCMNSLITLEH